MSNQPGPAGFFIPAVGRIGAGGASFLSNMDGRKKLLLHTCCGTCGAWIPQTLAPDFLVDLFYFNPNIHPEAEYLRRLADVKKAADALRLRLIVGEYEPRTWFKAVRGLAQEPEGGLRCPVCFELRLRRTAEYARHHGYDCFATTLTVGRNKRADVINPLGESLARECGVEFLPRDFKKQAGFEKSCRQSDAFGVVRQNYCGCVYSRLERFRYKKSPLTAIERHEHDAADLSENSDQEVVFVQRLS